MSQEKHVKELLLLKRFDINGSKAATIPIGLSTKITKDENGASIYEKRYRDAICSLLYLTASHPDIIFCLFMCDFRLIQSHLKAANRFFDILLVLKISVMIFLVMNLLS